MAGAYLSPPEEEWWGKASVELWALCTGFGATLEVGFSGEMHLSILQ